MNQRRLKELLARYGRVAMITYFSLFALVFGGFALAISMGIEVDGATSGAGVLGAAYVATKLTQPLRILATLGLTPLLSAALVKLGWTGEPPAPASTSEASTTEAP